MKYESKIKNLPKSEVEIEVALPAEDLAKARDKALKKFSQTIEVDGFRKGNVPEKIVLEKLSERVILEEAGEILLTEHYPQIIAETKLDTIGRPEIAITKLALGNPFEFKIKVAIIPKFDLPDYKKIAQEILTKNKEQKFEASQKEIDEVLLQIRKNKAHFDWHRANPEVQDHNHPDLEKEENLPALDDKLAQEAGNFKNLDELKAKIKENIETDKKNREIEKRRAEILDKLVAQTKLEAPEVLIKSETEKSLAQFKDDIARMGGQWADYLTHAKKTEDDLRQDMKESSEKRAKIQLIFNKIAEVEKLVPNKEVFENEVKQLKAHHPEADEENIRIFVTTLLLNQEVLKLLENN